MSTAIAVVGLGLLVAGSLATGDPLGMLSALAAGALLRGLHRASASASRARAFSGSAVLAASFSIGAVVLLPAVFTSDMVAGSAAASRLSCGSAS